MGDMGGRVTILDSLVDNGREEGRRGEGKGGS